MFILVYKIINFVKSLYHIKYKSRLFLQILFKKDVLNNLEIIRIYDYKFTFRISTSCNKNVKLMILKQGSDHLKAFLNTSHGKVIIKKDKFEDKSIYLKSLGKLWEDRKAPDLNDFEIYQKIDILNQPKKSYLKIKSPKIVNYKLLNFRFTYKLPVFQTQVQTLFNCLASISSNSFIDINNKRVFVDEYSNRYPNTSDTKNEPHIFGFDSNSVLIDSKVESLKESEYQIIQEGFWLCGIAFTEWAHFVSSFITKLPVMMEHPRWNLAPLYVPDDITKIQLNIITEVFGVRNISKVNSNKDYFFKKLYVVPTEVYSPVSIKNNSNIPSNFIWVNPESIRRIDFYFSRFLFSNRSNQKTKLAKQIYWSRGSNSRRFLDNRTTLDRLMEETGFQLFDPVKHDLKEQLFAFKNADIIVGEMAAFIFLSFINPKCKIILLNSDWKFHMYPALSCLNSLRETEFELLIGKRKSTKDYKTENGAHATWMMSKKNFLKLSKIISDF